MSGEPDRVHWRSLALGPDSRLKQRGRLAVCALCEYMGGDDCYPSLQSIAKRMGASERTARSAVDELESQGWLTIKRRAGTPHRYRRALPLAATPANAAEVTPARAPANTAADSAAELDNEITRGAGPPKNEQSKIAQLRERVGWSEDGA